MSPRHDHRGPAVAFVVLFLVAVLVMGDQMLARAVGGTTYLAFDRAPRVLLAVRPAPREVRPAAAVRVVATLTADVASVVLERDAVRPVVPRATHDDGPRTQAPRREARVARPAVSSEHRAEGRSGQPPARQPRHVRTRPHRWLSHARGTHHASPPARGHSAGQQSAARHGGGSHHGHPSAGRDPGPDHFRHGAGGRHGR